MDSSHQYDTISKKGVDNGLYQSCMKSIRKAHFQANRLRAGLVIAGLFTDIELYREVISLFYIVTSAMERKTKHLASEGDVICKKILELGYNFTPQYESDLEYLYGDNWKEHVYSNEQRSSIIIKYKEKIESATSGIDVIGPCFVLHGALIIGGGAAVMPKIEKLCGSKDACNLFKDVTGPGRLQRRQTFIKVWDSLIIPKDEKDFDDAVMATRECMQYNNDIFTSLQRNPWWWKYLFSTTVLMAGAASVISFRYLSSMKKSV